MKKLFTLLIVISFLAFAAAAFAAGASQTAWNTGNIQNDAGGGSDITVKLSPNVSYVYKGGATGGAYVVATQNSNGTKTYGASYDIQGIKMANDKVAVSAVPNATSNATSWATGTWYDVGK